MKRTLRRRKDEPLYKWLDRVTEYILSICINMDHYRQELRDILGEISKESYIEGVHTEQKLEKKYHR